MKSKISIKKFRGVKPINAFIITVLEGCGEVDDPYREVQYVVQITKDGCKVLCEYEGSDE